MGRHVVTLISQDALRHNLQQVRKIAPNSKIIAMVKANAYGHGLGVVTRTLAQAKVDALGVACIEEALAIRHEGISTDVVLMEGIFRPEELILAQKHHLTLVVHHWQQIQALQAFSASLDHRFKVWLKINTGMNRLGFSEAEVNEAWQTLHKLPQVELMGFMTHFAQADEPQNSLTQTQQSQFERIVGNHLGKHCLANSAGILAWPRSHKDWIRPGLMLYGASPFANTIGQQHALKPVMTLRSEIIAIKNLKAGEKVGYGGMWQTHKEAKIGIVAIGYGDGYPWHAKNGTPVLVNGQRAPLAGRVSMDMLAVDLCAHNEVKVGDPVILWGEGLPVEEVARHAGTIPYELLCRFTDRVILESF